MIVKRERKSSWFVRGVVFVLITYFSMRVLSLRSQNNGVLTLDMFGQAFDNLWKIWTPIKLDSKSIVISLGIGLFAILTIETYSLQQKKNIQEHSMGSSDWESEDAFKRLKDKDFYNNMILTKKVIVSKLMSTTKLNKNILMVGRPGTGKSRLFFKPNLLNANGNTIICTDPKGELLRDCGFSLKLNGYDIKVLNLDEKYKSNHYNPLHYIKKAPKEAPMLQDIINSYEAGKDDKLLTQEEFDYQIENMIQEDDVMSQVNCLMANTKGENIEQTTGDPYWEHATNLYLQALIYLALWQKKQFKQPCNYPKILDLIRKSQIDPNTKKSDVDIYYEAVKQIDKDYIGLKQWEHFKLTATSPKMMATIITEATVRISSFNIKEISDMCSTDDMELERIGKEGKEGRVAYFIVTNPNDNTFNFLANMFYSQVFNIIDSNAKANDGFLATTTDLFMDEWAQLGEIPRFVEILAYVRGLNAGITIGIQSLSQLKNRYRDNWETILDCCDYFLFLGSKSKETLQYVSDMIGKKTWYKKSSGRTMSKQNSSTATWDVHGRELAMIDELERMKKGYSILIAGEYKPFYSELYDVTKHPRYKELYEPWEKDDEENLRKKYNHFKEMQKTELEKEYEKEVLKYCRYNGYKIEDFELPFTKNDYTSSVSEEDIKFYTSTGGFLKSSALLKTLKE